MKIWDNYFQKNPQDAKRNILSLVFEDGEDTYTEECLFTVTERKKPIRVTEYVFNSASLSKQDIKMIISSLQQMKMTNKFNEPTGKGERFDRISVSPDYMNIETTTDGRAIPGGGHGMDYSIEESKTNENMKKNIIKLNETELKKIIAESVKKVLSEIGDTPRGQYAMAAVAGRANQRAKTARANGNQEEYWKQMDKFHNAEDARETARIKSVNNGQIGTSDAARAVSRGYNYGLKNG